MNRTITRKLHESFKYWMAVLLLVVSVGGCGMTNGKGSIIKQTGTIQNEQGEGTDILRWHPDSRHLAVTGTKVKYIYVWDVASRILKEKLEKKRATNVTQMTYSSDGKYLISRDPTVGDLNKYGKKTGCFTLWLVADHYRLVDDTQTYHAFRYLFQAPSNWIYTYESVGSGAKDPKIIFYEVPSMKRHDHHRNLDGPDTLAFSLDGRYMAEGYTTREKESATWDDKFHLRLWKYPEMELVWDNKEVHHGTVESIAFSPDGKFLVTGPYATDKRIERFTGSRVFERINPAYLEPLKLWETQSGRFVRDIVPLEDPIERLYFLDETHMLGVNSLRQIIVWNYVTGKELDRYTISDDHYVFTAELSPDKKTLAFGKKDTILLFQFDLSQK